MTTEKITQMGKEIRLSCILRSSERCWGEWKVDVTRISRVEGRESDTICDPCREAYLNKVMGSVERDNKSRSHWGQPASG